MASSRVSMRPFTAGVIAALVLMPHSISAAPPTVELSHALEAAIKSNPLLLGARLDVTAAEAAIQAAQGVEDWVVDAAIAWSSFRTASVSTNILGTSGSDTFEASMGAGRTLRTGGTLSLTARAALRRQSFNVDIPGQDDTSRQYTDSVTVAFTQPLLRGRGTAMTYAQKRSARAQRSATQLERTAAAQLVVRDVLIAYWDLAFAHQDRAIRQGSLRLAKQRLEVTQARISAGTVAQTQALAVEQAIATRQQEVIASELNIAERSLELRRLTGMTIGPGRIQLHINAAPTVGSRSFSLDSLLAEALANSPQIAALRKREQGATIEAEVTQNGLLPQLDFAVSAGPTGVGTTAGRALKETASFGGFSVGASLTYRGVVGNHAARGDNQRARAAITRAKLTLADAQAQTAQALVRVIKIAETSRARWHLSKRIIKLAERNIAAEQGRFELGRSTNFDVLQRQEELKQAQLRQVQAAVDFLRAEAAIDAIIGVVLDKYGVVLPRDS